jgi:hypothetical protein
MPNQTEVVYGGKSTDGTKIVSLKDKLLNPALTSQYEVKIPVGAGNLNAILKKYAPSTAEQQTLNISCSEASLPGSSIATFELKNDFTGVTERYAHRRMYDDRIDFTFYVDSDGYLPIRFFEGWMRFVTGESGPRADGSEMELTNTGYHYRMNYPKEYRCEGLKIVKFERNRRNSLEYEFVGAYPISVSSMPVGYDSSSLLKCTVSMTYLRYVITDVDGVTQQPKVSTTAQKPDVSNTQPPPVAQENASDVQQSVIQQTGAEGEGLYDLATGARLLSTEQQIIEQGKVGDKVTPALAAELQRFADGR